VTRSHSITPGPVFLFLMALVRLATVAGDVQVFLHPQDGCRGSAFGSGAGLVASRGVAQPHTVVGWPVRCGRGMAYRAFWGIRCPAERGGEPGGIRTRDTLIKRYLALNGVAL
jgi:hypothetical protein